MVEEDLYIPGLIIDPTDSEPPPFTNSPSGSSEELSHSHVSSAPRPSTSLPDIPSSYSNFQGVRRSTSERYGARPLGSPDTLPPPLPTLPTLPNPRVFPRPVRPITSHFKLHNLLSKRSGRDDGGETDDSDQPRKSKKGSPGSTSLLVSLRLEVSACSAVLNRMHSVKKKRRNASPGGKSIQSRPYINNDGTLSNSTLRSNRTITAPRTPAPGRREFVESEPPPPLPPVEDTSGDLEIDFQDLQNDELLLPCLRSFSYSNPEEEEEIEGKWKPTANVLSSLNSGLMDQVEHIDSNDWDETFAMIPPPPPPKNIPMRLSPLVISSPSSSEPSSASATTGLSVSIPDRFTHHFDRNEERVLSPASETSGPMKSLSTTSLAISSTCSTGQVPTSPQNVRSSNSLIGCSPIFPPDPDMPPNPRQHKLLETIYTQMHAARSVSLSPTGLLDNCIRTHFKCTHSLFPFSCVDPILTSLFVQDVRTHAPLVFSFPPPPGCQHRQEFDAAELELGRLNQQRNVERHGNHNRDSNVHPSLLFAFPLPPGRPEFDDTPPTTRPFTPSSGAPSLKSTTSRERSFGATGSGPALSRVRSSSVRSNRSFTPDPEPTNYRRPCLKTSRSFVGPIDWTSSDRPAASREGLATGGSEFPVMSGPMAGEISSARVAGAARNISNARDECERSRQRSDSIPARLIDVKGKRESGESKKKSLFSALKFTRPSTTGSFPPSSFGYKDRGATTSSPPSPSIASTSSSTISQYDYGKRKLTPIERAQLNAFPNKNVEMDPRSLNLHLRVRVVEILGCSEAMWDWVREFQSQEIERERKRKEKLAQAAKTVRGVGGGRVAHYHHDRVRNRGGDGSQPGLSSKTSGEPTSPVSRTVKDPLSLARKASGTSAEQPATPAKPVKRRVGGGRVSYFHEPVRNTTGARKRSNSSADRPVLRNQRSMNSTIDADGKKLGDSSGLGGYGQGRIPKSSGTAPSLFSMSSRGSAKSDDPFDHIEKSIRQELRHMKRERFDEVLSWFQL